MLPKRHPGHCVRFAGGQEGGLSPGRIDPTASRPTQPRPPSPPRRAPPRPVWPVVHPGFGFDRLVPAWCSHVCCAYLSCLVEIQVSDGVDKFPDITCMKSFHGDKKIILNQSAASYKERLVLRIYCLYTIYAPLVNQKFVRREDIQPCAKGARGRKGQWFSLHIDPLASHPTTQRTAALQGAAPNHPPSGVFRFELPKMMFTLILHFSCLRKDFSGHLYSKSGSQQGNVFFWAKRPVGIKCRFPLPLLCRALSRHYSNFVFPCFGSTD